METTLDQESPSKVRLTVTATSSEVAPALERAVKTLAGEVKIPGFRPGKAPRKLLESRLGADALKEATLQEAIPELVSRAIEEKVLRPVATPKVEVTSYELDGDLVFDAMVEVRPEIELPPLDGLKAVRPQTAPTDDEIDTQLERLRDRFGALEPVERPAATGDFALIDITGSVLEQRIDPLSSTDELYEIGTGFPIAEMDGELSGSKAGDILRFTATLPEGVGGEHAGREVTFGVLVKEIREKKLPMLDDEFSKTASEFDTLEELRADVAERIRKAKESNADAEIRSQVLESLLEEVDVEAPDALIDEEMRFRAQRLGEQLQMAGLSFEQYLEQSGSDEEKLQADLRFQATRNVTAQLVLEEIGRRQELKVSQDELRDEIAQHAAALRADPKQLTETLTKDGRILALAGDIIRRKALDFLVERADIKEEASAEPDGSDGAPAAQDE